MPNVPFEPHPALVVHSGFDDTAIRRACLRGDLVRLVAGRYLRRAHWDALSAADRHVMTAIAAVSCLRTEVVVSHSSAAAFWGLPRLGPWPARVHVLDPRLEKGTTGRFVSRHTGPLHDDDVAVRHGILVTEPTRTATDIALSAPFRQAVVALDHGLRTDLFTRAGVVAAIGRQPTRHGVRKALSAVDFADARANRPGESLSRVVMLESGVSAPDLQRTFRGARGQKAEVDFFWQDAGVIGEFDGETKYRDSARWSGLPPEEVVIREKDRENWLRAHPDVNGFVRWTWREALAAGFLPRLLREAGVPSERRAI